MPAPAPGCTNRAGPCKTLRFQAIAGPDGRSARRRHVKPGVHDGRQKEWISGGEEAKVRQSKNGGYGGRNHEVPRQTGHLHKARRGPSRDGGCRPARCQDVATRLVDLRHAPELLFQLSRPSAVEHGSGRGAPPVGRRASGAAIAVAVARDRSVDRRITCAVRQQQG